jgi:hypothetical protein
VLGLLAGLARKNCWTMAEDAGEATPDGMQHLLEQASPGAGGPPPSTTYYMCVERDNKQPSWFTLLVTNLPRQNGIGSAAAKCSNQADLHLTFIDPIWPSDLPQRPSLTSMPLATDQKVGRFEFLQVPSTS